MSMPEKKTEQLYKMLLIGSSGIGKTSLLRRYSQGTYNESYLASIGVDFQIKKIEIDEQPIKLQLWDTAGQERFRTIVSSYYRGAHGVLICFDSMTSFQDAIKFYEECQVQAAKAQILMVQTKNDIEINDISYDAVQAFLAENNLEFIKTSAKLNNNVDQAFEILARKIYLYNTILGSEQSKNENNLNIEEKSNAKDQKKSSMCCQLG